MQLASQTPPIKDLVLIGGGHAHVQVLRSLGMRPIPGLRVTLINRDLQTPYSGMLPGCVAEQYTEQDIHIQLGPLCRFANTRMIQAEVERVDPEQQRVYLVDRPPITYDCLSINSGAEPKAPHPDAITVKPISRFLPKWHQVKGDIGPSDTLVIVGAGAGGVELAMACRAALGAEIAIELIGSRLLPGQPASAVRKLQQHLHQQNIRWRAARAEPAVDGVRVDDELLRTPFVLWVTDVRAAPWIKDSGFATDEQGFLRVDAHLRSVSHPSVFAAGDAASLDGQPRPKAGVFAVRAGPVLTENIRRSVALRKLVRFKAQDQYLILLNTSDGQAIASRGRWSAQGRLWWLLKDYIDRKFMNRFNELPKMDAVESKPEMVFGERFAGNDMRCGGCGAKLAAAPLQRVLQRLPQMPEAAAKLVRLGVGDDAAELINCGDATLLSVDGFRAMIDDPYLFGRIATHHSLNDLFAMAAVPRAALAFVTVPLMAESLMEEELFQLLSGVCAVLHEHQVGLVGGHSAEGAELTLGLTVSGTLGAQTLHKAGAQPGDRLLLSKPLGTGVILAGAMQGNSDHLSMGEVLAQMDQSNATALQVMLEHGARALTDVTGFGLAGHLGEMLRASGQGVDLNLAAIPVLPAALSLLPTIQSSLQQANEGALRDYDYLGTTQDGALKVRLLADPQTSGGLLASMPAEHAESACRALQQAGYGAALIGEVTAQSWRILDG